jgi:hypothetical protein
MLLFWNNHGVPLYQCYILGKSSLNASLVLLFKVPLPISGYLPLCQLALPAHSYRIIEIFWTIPNAIQSGGSGD